MRERSLTVGEVIALLRQFPADLPVYSECDYDWIAELALGDGPRYEATGRHDPHGNPMRRAVFDVPAVVLR